MDPTPFLRGNAFPAVRGAAYPRAKQDPRLGVFNRLAGQGQTPISVNFGKTFNDTNGPWTQTVIDAVFGGGDVGSILKQHNAAVTESLAGGS